ncbi:MAG: hypothetical protein ACRD2N_25555 [Vicinamibacterales bacterium]
MAASPVLLLLGVVPLARRFPRDWYPITLVYFPVMFITLIQLADPIVWYVLGKRP